MKKTILLVGIMMMLLMVASVSADYTLRPDVSGSILGFNTDDAPSVIDENLATGMTCTDIGSGGCLIQPYWVTTGAVVAGRDNFSTATQVTMRVNYDQVKPTPDDYYIGPGYIELGCYSADGNLITTVTTFVDEAVSQQWVELNVTDCVGFIVDEPLPDYMYWSIEFLPSEYTDMGSQLGASLSIYELEFFVTEAVSNTEPVVNSIIPSERIELTNGEAQLYSASVNDSDGDGVYSWTLGGIVVSSSETYTANWDDIESGVYTLELEVSDAEYSDTASTTLEIRAVGGASSGGSSNVVVVEDVIVDVVTEDSDSASVSSEKGFVGTVWGKVSNFFKNLFNRG